MNGVKPIEDMEAKRREQPRESEWVGDQPSYGEMNFDAEEKREAVRKWLQESRPVRISALYTEDDVSQRPQAGHSTASGDREVSLSGGSNEEMGGPVESEDDASLVSPPGAVRRRGPVERAENGRHEGAQIGQVKSKIQWKECIPGKGAMDKGRPLWKRFRMSFGGHSRKGILKNPSGGIKKGAGRPVKKGVAFQVGDSDSGDRWTIAGMLRALLTSSVWIQIWSTLRVLVFLGETFQWPYRLAAGLSRPNPFDFALDASRLIDITACLISAIRSDRALRDRSYGSTKKFLRCEGIVAFVGTLLPYFGWAGGVSGTAYRWMSVLKINRVYFLFVYFRKREHDLHVSIQRTAFLKFSVLTLGTGHWVGSLFFYIARATGFPSKETNLSWVRQFSQERFPIYNVDDSSPAENYAVMLFKGLSTLAAVNFVDSVPKKIGELVWAVFTFYVTIVLAGFILGTLFHYLINKDKSIVEMREKLNALERFAENRDLDSELSSRLRNQFLFQFRKQQQKTTAFRMSLPDSLAAKVSKFQFGWIISQNSGLFKGVNDEFLQVSLSVA